jgi:predicted TIM-barrel fold metal-dependent hydrolase
MFEALVEYDLPLVLHGSLSMWPQHTPVGDGMLSWTEMLGLDWPVHAQVTVANMIMSGVFDAFPDLQVVIEEGGHWWLPFLRYRLDEFYEMHPDDVIVQPRKYERGERRLHRKPSAYLRDNVYVTTQPMAPPERTREFEQMLELSMAKDTFLYSSDWPHQTLDPATWAFSAPFDEDLRNAILHENAEALFGI